MPPLMNETPTLPQATPAPLALSNLSRKMGFWLFLSSELLIFCGLIGAFLVTKSYSKAWPTAQELSLWLVSLNTFLLLTSSLTVVLAIDSAREGKLRPVPIFIAISALLGVGFLAGQAVEYTHLITVEGHGFGDAFGTAFFILTGLHGLHVLVGVIWAFGVAARARARAYGPGNYASIEVFGLYWHFVDLVWILIFTVVYLIS